MRKKIKEIIFESIREVSALQSNQNEDISEKMELFGSQGIFDSMAFVTFITDVEQKIADEFLVNTAIADEKVFSYKDSPFRSVGSFVDYIMVLLEKAKK